ncbi:MAG: aspartyl protease family protein [Candidatus Eisenbacteria bacterium]
MRSRTVVAVTSGLLLLALACAAGAQGPGGLGPGAPGRPPMDETNRGELLQDLERARAAHVADPGDADARHGCAQLTYESGDFEGALLLLEPLLAEKDPAIDVLMLAARIEYLRGSHDRAEELLQRILAREPDNAPALMKLVFVYYQTNQYDRCRTLPVEALGDRRIPHLDLMLAFEDAPYQVVWRDGERTVVPFLVTDPLPVIKVEVNGREVTALIDTGGDSFILDPTIASELGIEIVASMMGMFAGGMEAEVGFARAKSLSLGGVTLNSVPMTVLPTNRMAIGGYTLDAIVGTGVLKQFLATLDYPNDRLVLRASTGAPDFYAEFAGTVVDEVPFYLQSTHFLLAKGSLNGVDDLIFHVDSGLAGTPAFSAPRQTLDLVGIPVPEVEVREGTMGGGGGGFAMGTFDIDQLGLGGLTQGDLIGSYGGLPPHSYRMHGFIQDGLISHNFLRHYALTLDFERMRMVFTQ